MIITRTPLRIPIGGGGTDLPSYYSQYGGFLISSAITKYVYIMVNRRFERGFRISYSKTEIVEHVEEIEHPIVREALKMFGIKSGLEIVSIADVPSNTGLGSSSSFTVGVLQALHTLQRETASPQQLAEEAFHLEVEVLKEPIGKQDQYMAAFGGIISMTIGLDGKVEVTPVQLNDHQVQELENNLTLWYTGLRRSASDVLQDQNESLKQSSSQTTEAMHRIKSIGLEINDALNQGQLFRLGELMDAHWQSKKKLTGKVSTDNVDRWYEIARSNGAVGGKIIGAGGGGFFLFYSDNGSKEALGRAMTAEGLQNMRVAIDFDGSKVVANL